MPCRVVPGRSCPPWVSRWHCGKQPACPFRVSRVGFVMSAVCPLYPEQRTFPDPVGISHLCQLPTSQCRRGAGQGYERPGAHRHQGRRRRGRPAGCQAPGPGKSRGCAVFEKASAGTPKLAARISGGVWATQSVRSSVLNSLALPSSKQMMNSHPSVPAPAMNAAGGQKGSTSRRDDHEPQGS